MQILPGNAEHLALSDYLRCLDPLYYRPRRYRRPRPLHRSYSPLDVAVIGFDPVITIAAHSLTAMPPHAAVGLQLSNRRRIAPEAISRKYVWRRIVRIGEL
jgi:hypothetical protein